MKRRTTNPTRPWAQKLPIQAKLSAFTVGMPNHWENRTQTTRKNQIITDLCKPTAHTHTMRPSNRIWREGKGFQSPKGVTFHADERMTIEKPHKHSKKLSVTQRSFFTAAWATAIFSTDVFYKNEKKWKFCFFRCVQPWKIISKSVLVMRHKRLRSGRVLKPSKKMSVKKKSFPAKQESVITLALRRFLARTFCFESIF